MAEIYNNIYLFGIGDFSTGSYWTSTITEIRRMNSAYTQSFGDVGRSELGMDTPIYVRAVRAF
jgi:hypothetical protein